MQGYFENAEATAAVVRDGGWIDTGDLGFVDDDGDLFVTGRAKDVIIAGGRNIYPQEVEEAVADVPGIRRGCVAAFGVQDPRTGTERLVVVAETRGAVPPDGSPLHAAVGGRDRRGDRRAGGHDRVRPAGQRAQDVLGQDPAIDDARALRERAPAPRTRLRGVAVGAAPRPASGVARRPRARLRRHRRSTPPGCGPPSRIVALPLWIAVALTRTPRQARRVIGVASRLLLLAGGCRPRVEGRDPATLPSPAVIVANHASFLDVLLLLAVLPPTVRFGAKARLTRYPILGTILRRADYVLVQRGARDSAAALAATIDDGDSLFIFPEGTFVRARGGDAVPPRRVPGRGRQRACRSCRSRCAARAPCGRTRSWRLRPGPMAVCVAEPLTSAETGWAAMVALRDASRAWIARESGEPAVTRGAVMIDQPPD